MDDAGGGGQQVAVAEATLLHICHRRLSFEEREEPGVDLRLILLLAADHRFDAGDGRDVGVRSQHADGRAEYLELLGLKTIVDLRGELMLLVGEVAPILALMHE
jgi:hypothetical protein